MANAGNWFETKRKAYKLRTKAITTASGNITYTAKVGSASDNFIVDAVIQITTTSTYSMTITVPDGVYAGQELLIVFVAEGGTETITTTTTTGDDGSSLTAASDYTKLLWIDDTNGWVVEAEAAT